MAGSSDIGAGGLLGGAGQYKPLVDPNTLSTQQKFMQFLQSPEAMALGASLLEQGQPSYTHTPSFSAGLGQGMEKIGGIQKYRNEQAFEREKLKQQELLEKARLEIMKGHLDVDRGKLDLERSNKARLQAQKEQQQGLLEKLLTGDTGIPGTQSDNRQQRAAILASAGYTEEAFKVLTEKPTEDAANKPTKAVLTQNQQISQAVDNVLPQIDSLLEEDVPVQSPNVFGLRKATSFISPEKQARYESKVASITDTLVAALALPKTNESLHLVGQMVRKQFGESDDAYHRRLEELKNDLESRKENALKVTSAVGENRPVKNKTASGNDGGSNNSSAGSEIGITPDGRHVFVPADKMEEFISKGGKRG